MIFRFECVEPSRLNRRSKDNGKIFFLTQCDSLINHNERKRSARILNRHVSRVLKYHRLSWWASESIKTQSWFIGILFKCFKWMFDGISTLFEWRFEFVNSKEIQKSLIFLHDMLHMFSPFPLVISHRKKSSLGTMKNGHVEHSTNR